MPDIDPEKLSGNLDSLISSFSFSWLIAGLLFSSIGIYVLRQGKKNANLRWVGIGIGLLLYSYFVTDPLWAWLVGVGLCVLAYLTRAS